ncbi:GTP-binding protein GEM [Caerostris extrusa]|uniref:GTP-binding protein GEM n=1 Tax=Caerostris extrusa TaxID=172846 RepID=A0AAV4NJ19_CAEEX|nr:GTP-binding protein GEM [Caerostris extrusa]
MTHQQSRTSRSPSKSRSRSSEKILDSKDVSMDKLDTPRFRMVTKSPSPCNNRRASAVHFTSTQSNSNGGGRGPDQGPCVPNEIRPTSPTLSVGPNWPLPIQEQASATPCPSKSRSASLCSTPTSPASECAFPEFSADAASASGGSSPSSPTSPVAITSPTEEKPIPKYTVWLMGSNGVGKSSIRNQFMTSEYICQYDNWRDESQNRSVIVSLDGEETELEIEEYATIEEKGRLKEPLPDAYIIVYSVTNRRSYIQARQILSKLETTFSTKAAILVANKTDLARLRTVPTVEGRSLAKERGCKFIETSVAINHQLDELLVGIITQIRIKAKIAEKHKKRSDRNTQHSRNKATCIIKRLWRKTCMTSKSCDNLHAL